MNPNPGQQALPHETYCRQSSRSGVERFADEPRPVARACGAERERILQDTEAEMLKLRAQSQREIESAGKVARTELRLFAARQSVKTAREVIRREIQPKDDANLIRLSIEGVGRSGI